MINIWISLILFCHRKNKNKMYNVYCKVITAQKITAQKITAKK